MKASLLLLAPALVAAAPELSIEKRQFLGFIGGTGPTKSFAVHKDGLKPEIDQTASRKVLMQHTPATHAKPGVATGLKLDPNSDALVGNIQPPCSDCSVLKANANLAYKDGSQANVGSGVYQHHIIIMQNGRAMLMPHVGGGNCGPLGPVAGFMSLLGGSMGSMGGPKGAAAEQGHMKRQFPAALLSLLPGISMFLGGGGSMGSGSGFAVPDSVSKVKSGIYVSPKDTMQFTSEVVNYENKPKDIYLTMDIEYLPSKTPGLLDVGMGAISLNCSNWAMEPPKDKAITYQGQEWTMIDNGYFVGFTPHLHDGGSNIKVYLNDKEICTSTASYGSNDGALELEGSKKWETITGYSPCDYMVEFKKGDKLRMTAEYDLTKYKLHPNSADHGEDEEGMALATYIWAKKT